jgi:dienelactone hydrolase
MSTIVPPSQLLQRAVRWLSDERSANPGRSALSVVEEASFRFDLSPSEEEWMIATFARPTSPEVDRRAEPEAKRGASDEPVARRMPVTKERGMASEERDVEVGAVDAALEGSLVVPGGASGLVLFAHGSGSSRFSPRNRYVASVLQSVGLATLLIDLLTAEEEAIDADTGELRFDIDFLAGRVAQTTDWLLRTPATAHLGIGYFGSSTGAAAALVAAAARPEAVGAVVSRGGRPDLATRALPLVRAPTLFVVGGDDTVVLSLNRAAFERLRCEKELEIVSGATHLFEEPGTLERVAELAALWFAQHLAAHQPAARV